MAVEMSAGQCAMLLVAVVIVLLLHHADADAYRHAIQGRNVEYMSAVCDPTRTCTGIHLDVSLGRDALS